MEMSVGRGLRLGFRRMVISSTIALAVATKNLHRREKHEHTRTQKIPMSRTRKKRQTEGANLGADFFG